MSYKNSLTYYVTLLTLFIIPLFYFKTYIGPLPLSAEIILIPLLVLAFLWDWRKGSIEFNDISIKWFVIAFSAFILISLLSFTKAVFFVPAVMETGRYLSYVVLFLIILKVKFTKEQYLNFAKVFGVAALFIGLFGALQYVFNFSLNKAGLYALQEAKGRIDSTLVNPNYYSSFLNFIIPTLVLLAVVYFKDKKTQLLFFAIYGVYIVNLILTYTRAAWVTMVCAFLMLIVIMPKRFLKGIIKPHILIAFLILGVFVYFMPDVQSRTNSAVYAIEKLVFKDQAREHVAGPDDEGQDTEEVEEEPSVEDETTNKAVVSRITLWKTGWVMFKDNPILGVGMGNYYDRYKEFTIKYPELDIGHDTYSVHNSYIKVAAETGTLGILAYLMVYVIYFVNIAILYFKQPNTLGKVLAAGLFVGSTTYMVQNMSNNLMFIPQLNIIFWLVGGLVLTFLHRNYKQFQ